MTSRSPSRQKGQAKSESKTTKSNWPWLDSLYDTANLSDQELKLVYEVIRYKGFNRVQVLKEMEELFDDYKLLSEIVLVCALRGPKKASVTTLSNGKTLEQMGVPASGTQGTAGLSCNRIAAATADLAAFYMKKLNVPKRIENLPLPGWLQFPTAGSIKLPDNYRKMHYEFSMLFSPMIGGVFNAQIYQSMVTNAYLDDKLHLF